MAWRGVHPTSYNLKWTSKWTTNLYGKGTLSVYTSQSPMNTIMHCIQRQAPNSSMNPEYQDQPLGVMSCVSSSWPLIEQEQLHRHCSLQTPSLEVQQTTDHIYWLRVHHFRCLLNYLMEFSGVCSHNGSYGSLTSCILNTGMAHTLTEINTWSSFRNVADTISIPPV